MNDKGNIETGGRDPLGRLMFPPPPVEKPKRAMDVVVYGTTAACALALVGVVLYAVIK